MRRHAIAPALLILAAAALTGGEAVLAPQIDGAFWQVAGDPDLGKYTTANQQPVDFGVWQAADGTWQLWSCIRGTKAPGQTRLLYRWQGAKLTDSDWRPMGIAMEADPGFGEVEGGLQAPFVTRHDGAYLMFYGDWDHICLARGADGKTFARQLTADAKAGMFTEGIGNNTRDPMALVVDGVFHLYYTAYPNKKGAVYLRTSKDLRSWSPAKKVAFGGAAGTGPYSAECPFVYYHEGFYYLFRTQRYGKNAQSSVYRSKDPANFGVDDDRYLVGTLPFAAPEIIDYQGGTYIAVLLPNLKGIQIAKLKFVPKP